MSSNSSKTKRCSCSSSGYSSQSLTSEHDSKKSTNLSQKYIKHSSKTLSSLASSSTSCKPLACRLDSCSRSSSTNICNQTTNSSATDASSSAASCCIRTSTPTFSLANSQSVQTSRSHHINYNHSASMQSGHASSSTSHAKLNSHKHPYFSENSLDNIQQQKIYQYQSLNKNLVSSISTITSEVDSPRTFTTSTSSTNNTTSSNLAHRNCSNFIYPLKKPQQRSSLGNWQK